MKIVVQDEEEAQDEISWIEERNGEAKVVEERGTMFVVETKPPELEDHVYLPLLGGQNNGRLC